VAKGKKKWPRKVIRKKECLFQCGKKGLIKKIGKGNGGGRK